jgi:hypothetical protein
MSKEQETEVTVRDRRMFNPDGSLRAGYQQAQEEKLAETAAAEAKPAAAAETKPAPPAEPKEVPQGMSAEFSNLVGMLTTNAILHLGADPQFGGQVDIETARHFIDMLSMLQEKTEGNLSLEEQQLLTDMTGRLRMEYVSVVNQMSKSAKKKV